MYGVEPWTYYPKNLALNFNLVFALAVLPGLLEPALALYNTAPLVCTLALFFALPHKEERFLSVVYPSFCVGAAYVLARRFPRALQAAFVACFAGLSVSRHLALARLAAPSTVLAGNAVQPGQTLCIGREWYRFPSSFALADGVALAWTRSEFNGQLPQPFAPWPGGFASTPQHMNDLNRFEPDTVVDPARCDWYVDSDEPPSERDALVAHGNDAWEPVRCDAFCDAARSPQPFRSFAVPFDPFYGVQSVQYCLWRRR